MPKPVKQMVSGGMKQKGTDMEGKTSTGDRRPGPESSKSIREPDADKNRSGKGETGEREPKGATASDSSAEKHGRMTGGVAMGKADRSGSQEGSDPRETSHWGKHEGVTGEYNEGRHNGIVYEHKRLPHTQGNKASKTPE